MRSERLTAFIFRLGRDNLPTGIVEEQAAVVERAHDHDSDVAYVGLSAEHLGAWAGEIADRLLSGLNEEQIENETLAKMREIVKLPYEAVPEGADSEDTRQRQADATRRDDARRYRRLADLIKGVE